MNRHDLTLALVKHALDRREEGAYAVAYLASIVPLDALEAALRAVHEMRATPPSPEPSERLLTLVRERYPHPQ